MDTPLRYSTMSFVVAALAVLFSFSAFALSAAAASEESTAEIVAEVVTVVVRHKAPLFLFPNQSSIVATELEASPTHFSTETSHHSSSESAPLLSPHLLRRSVVTNDEKTRGDEARYQESSYISLATYNDIYSKKRQMETIAKNKGIENTEIEGAQVNVSSSTVYIPLISPKRRDGLGRRALITKEAPEEGQSSDELSTEGSQNPFDRCPNDITLQICFEKQLKGRLSDIAALAMASRELYEFFGPVLRVRKLCHLEDSLSIYPELNLLRPWTLECENAIREMIVKFSMQHEVIRVNDPRFLDKSNSLGVTDFVLHSPVSQKPFSSQQSLQQADTGNDQFHMAERGEETESFAHFTSAITATNGRFTKFFLSPKTPNHLRVYRSSPTSVSTSSPFSSSPKSSWWWLWSSDKTEKESLRESTDGAAHKIDVEGARKQTQMPEELLKKVLSALSPPSDDLSGKSLQPPSASSSLQSFTLHDAKITEGAADALASFLQKNPQLLVIRFLKVKFSSMTALKSLSLALETSNSLGAVIFEDVDMNPFFATPNNKAVYGRYEEHLREEQERRKNEISALRAFGRAIRGPATFSKGEEKLPLTHRQVITLNHFRWGKSSINFILSGAAAVVFFDSLFPLRPTSISMPVGQGKEEVEPSETEVEDLPLQREDKILADALGPYLSRYMQNIDDKAARRRVLSDFRHSVVSSTISSADVASSAVRHLEMRHCSHCTTEWAAVFAFFLAQSSSSLFSSVKQHSAPLLGAQTFADPDITRSQSVKGVLHYLRTLDITGWAIDYNGLNFLLTAIEDFNDADSSPQKGQELGKGESMRRTRLQALSLCARPLGLWPTDGDWVALLSERVSAMGIESLFLQNLSAEKRPSSFSSSGSEEEMYQVRYIGDKSMALLLKAVAAPQSKIVALDMHRSLVGFQLAMRSMWVLEHHWLGRQRNQQQKMDRDVRADSPGSLIAYYASLPSTPILSRLEEFSFSAWFPTLNVDYSERLGSVLGELVIRATSLRSLDVYAVRDVSLSEVFMQTLYDYYTDYERAGQRTPTAGKVAMEKIAANDAGEAILRHDNARKVSLESLVISCAHKTMDQFSARALYQLLYLLERGFLPNLKLLQISCYIHKSFLWDEDIVRTRQQLELLPESEEKRATEEERGVPETRSSLLSRLAAFLFPSESPQQGHASQTSPDSTSSKNVAKDIIRRFQRVMQLEELRILGQDV